MKLKFVNLICVLCVFALPLSAQTTLLRSITHDGLQRDYRLYVPAIYTGSTTVPLVFNLHGYTSNGFEQEIYGDFKPVADTANFILIHPEGTLDNSGTTFWNAFGSPTETVDDVGFLSALIDSIAAEYNIDMNRVYSTGMSNGGFMSYKLACDLSYRIAAIASVTGTMIVPNLATCSPVHPTPVMQIHGTADPTVPYNGTVNGFVAVPALAQYWADFNNCDATPTQTAVPDINTADGCTADHFFYANGDAGSTVELYRINGGGHTWPGSPAVITIGVTNRDFSASAEIWRFFNQYRLNELTTGISDADAKGRMQVFPNPNNGLVSVVFSSVENRMVRVSNSLGQLVFEKAVNVARTELELPTRGVYFLSVYSSEGVFTQKLIRD